ncbi:MAG: radical SAM protein [Candidatus Omnitrophota bacterium]
MEHVSLVEKSIGMKVLLACPNDSELAASFSKKGGVSIPLGLAYLGAYVQDIPGIELAGLDNNALKLEPEKYREIIAREAPDIVAISVMTATVFTTWEMARVVKDINPRAIIVVGGGHCSALPESTFEEPAIDYGVVGEGEEAFRELLMALLEKRDPSRIPNLIYRHDGKVHVNPRRSPIRDIDKIPFPKRDLFDNSKYNMNVNRRATSGKNTTLLTSRGCPYGCIFCSKSIYGHHFNQRSPKNVIEEIKALENEGYSEILIVDDTFTVHKKWVLEFCGLFSELQLKMRWNCHARVNTLDEETVSAMKRAHCTGMAFGIESGNPEMLKKIDKRITLDQAREAVRLCRKYGISTLCSYIFGHPGDTRQTMNDTLRVALELDSDYANFCVLVPMPGSKIFDDLMKKENVEKRWDRYLAHSKSPMANSLCEISQSELQTIQKSAFRRFYFRPKYIWRKLLAIKNPAALWNLIKGAYIVLLFQIQAVSRKNRGETGSRDAGKSDHGAE